MYIFIPLLGTRVTSKGDGKPVHSLAKSHDVLSPKKYSSETIIRRIALDFFERVRKTSRNFLQLLSKKAKLQKNVDFLIDFDQNLNKSCVELFSNRKQNTIFMYKKTSKTTKKYVHN